MSDALPKEGQVIYLPTELHLSRGVDDFSGGRCVISKVVINRHLPTGHANRLFFEVKENPGTEYSWAHYGDEKKQAKLKKAYGNKKGRRDPDFRPEFNRWL